jgi:hypothetical protein
MRALFLARLAADPLAAYRDFVKDTVECKRAGMPILRDIKPVFRNIQDTLVRSEASWIQQSPMSAIKVLCVGRETGTVGLSASLELGGHGEAPLGTSTAGSSRSGRIGRPK